MCRICANATPYVSHQLGSVQMLSLMCRMCLQLFNACKVLNTIEASIAVKQLERVKPLMRLKRLMPLMRSTK